MADPTGLPIEPSAPYHFLDSGDLTKLEQIGDRTIIRPSSLAVWKRRQPTLWKDADAEFVPSRGWRYRGEQFERARCTFEEMTFELHLQKNGQIGLFPEHFTYFDELKSDLTRISESGSTPVKVLNLFAYTGLATVWCTKHGANVCHVDLSKSALTWAETNFKLNAIPRNLLRIICDDALKFLEREIARENTYDVVLADPPSFSRPSKGKSWQLDEVIKPLIGACLRVINKERGAIFIASHHQGLTGEVIGNLIYDEQGDAALRELRSYNLSIPEHRSPRLLPAGQVAIARW